MAVRGKDAFVAEIIDAFTNHDYLKIHSQYVYKGISVISILCHHTVHHRYIESQIIRANPRLHTSLGYRCSVRR